VTGVYGRIAAIAVLFLGQAAAADAPEINVYSTVAMRGVLEDVVPQFEKESGQTLAISWGTAAVLTKRIEAGEPVDVAILTRPNIDTLIKDGKIASGAEATLARSSIAVAVKSGAAKPDLSTPDALKQTLLQAKSIAYSNPASGGASGVYFAKLLDRLGIAHQMKVKTKYPPAGGNSASLVAAGEAELAVQQKPELLDVAGVDIAGLLPGDLNKVTVFAAGITAASAKTKGAQAFLKFLQTPETAKVLRAHGFDTD